MEGSEAPRRVIHPGPTPRSDPDPVTEAVRSPANDGNVGEPHGAVLRHGAPTAVVVEIFVAGYIVGNIAASDAVIFVKVALIAPGIEVVGIRERHNIGVQRVRSGEITLLA